MEIQVGEIRRPRELIPVEVRAYMIQSMMMIFLADTMFDQPVSKMAKNGNESDNILPLYIFSNYIYNNIIIKNANR